MPPQPPPPDDSNTTTSTTSTTQPTTNTNVNSMDQYISLTASHAYWSSIPPTNDGMLGGYESVTTPDLKQSKRFISQVRRILQTQSQSSTTTTTTTSTTTSSASTSSSIKPSAKIGRAVDCGAGIGRITKGLLVKIADTVDVVEPIPKFADEVKLLKGQIEGVGDVYVEGLESWIPAEGRKYGLIWNQWCLGHLTDGQLVEYLRRVKGALTGDTAGVGEHDTSLGNGEHNTNGKSKQHDYGPVEEKGWIMVKENLSKEKDGDIFDEQDSSVTRTDRNFRRIFAEAGLTVIKSARQEGFPSELYVVMMYALRPR